MEFVEALQRKNPKSCNLFGVNVVFLMEQKSTSDVLHLDLNNFNKPEAEESRYVLTSPRSLESCARLDIKPVDLLIKSLNQLVTEQQHVPSEVVRVMHESYEKERMKLLQMCRVERERISQTDSCPGSGLDKVPISKLKDHSGQRHSMPYAELCSKGKSMSRTSCSTAGDKDLDRSTVCSFRLGDLRQFPATERKLQRLTADIERKMCVTVAERDRKIAALMLIKHEEEQAHLMLRQQQDHKREEARKQSEILQAQKEKTRRKNLKQSLRCWQEKLEVLRRLREQREKEKVEQLEQEVKLKENHWRRLKEEVEETCRKKMEASRKEAGSRKCYQEKLLKEKEEAEQREQEKERRILMRREEKARRNRELQAKEERKKIQEVNQRELLRHMLLRQQKEQQVEEEETLMRSSLEKKMQYISVKHAQAVKARLKEQHERTAKEEQQVQRAKLRSKLQRDQELTHKQILLHLSQRRLERAALLASNQRRSRARQLDERNKHRQLCHQRLKERLQSEEEAVRKDRERNLSAKDLRQEKLRRQQEQILQEAQTLTRASFFLRDRVRQQIQSRSFCHMVAQAQLTDCMSHMKL